MTELLALCTTARPYNISNDLAVDLYAFAVLSTRQPTLAPSIHVEPSLPIVDPAFLVRVRDGFRIDSTFVIAFDALDGLEDEIGRQVCELLDATVANDRSVVVALIPKKTYLVDGEMAA